MLFARSKLAEILALCDLNKLIPPPQPRTAAATAAVVAYS